MESKAFKVEFLMCNHPELRKDFVIKWDTDETLGTVGFTVLLDEEDREVIGNIYESKELLGQVDQ